MSLNLTRAWFLLFWLVLLRGTAYLPPISELLTLKLQEAARRIIAALRKFDFITSADQVM